MNEEEQKKIFSKNLNYYISLSGKQQKEVAKDLGIRPTTFNTWCVGKIMPSMGKVQKIADYFHIGKTDLTDDKLNNDGESDAMLLCDLETMEMIKKYYTLSKNDKDVIQYLINSFAQKNGANNAP